MKFHELKTRPSKQRRRVGRGISAGGGKTAGRGTKGQNSRKSGGVRVGFEGGQMPLYMRIPKLRGFKSKRPGTSMVNLSDLQDLKTSTIDNHALAEAGLISDAHVDVKVVSTGEIKRKTKVKLQKASASAIKAIEKAGGKFERTDRPKRPKLKKK